MAAAHAAHAVRLPTIPHALGRHSHRARPCDTRSSHLCSYSRLLPPPHASTTCRLPCATAAQGFDPLNLASVDLNLGGAEDKQRSAAYILRDYREAELRHGRLAMLAALAWPVQEMLSPVISRALREPILLAETAGRSPSVE